MKLFVTAAVCLLLNHTNAAESRIIVFSSQGCSIAIDKTWKILNKEEKSQILNAVKRLSTHDRKRILRNIENTTVLFSAMKKGKNLRTLSLLAMAPEGSQKEVATWRQSN
jgi:hypothetical protein